MSSLFAIFDIDAGDDLAALRRTALDCSRKQRHRGPDHTCIHADSNAVLVQEHLSVDGPNSVSPQLHCRVSTVAVALDGHVCNAEALRKGLDNLSANCSEQALLGTLYRRYGSGLVSRLEGAFALALSDPDGSGFLVARDPVGVCPLYWGHDQHGRLCVASELKALADICSDVSEFPAGHVYDSKQGLSRYYERPWRDYAATRGTVLTAWDVRQAFKAAVGRNLVAEAAYGVLLSGGLDSSLLAACVARQHSRLAAQAGVEALPLRSFAVGLEGSPDLAAAQKAADAIGTLHHSVVYSIEEGLDALPEVVRHIESYDVTTVRSSIPMYLMARRIRAMGIRMVFSGEGADELFGGYLYFHKAPDARAFHDETVRKLESLHHYDCLRVNKSMQAWGVEARVPFLDLAFVDAVMGMDATEKMSIDGRVEKHVLRQAFEDMLPAEIAWRQKEQFSDGVGYSWIDALKAHAESVVGDREFAAATARFPHNTPETKEAWLYRDLFERFYPGQACAQTVPGGKSIACSSPAALDWCPEFAGMADPSGRAVRGVHAAAVDSI